MKVVEAWKKGYTGKGVVVSILDDGIQPNHPDLRSNYVSEYCLVIKHPAEMIDKLIVHLQDPLASYDINENDLDPTPQDNGDNK